MPLTYVFLGGPTGAVAEFLHQVHREGLADAGTATVLAAGMHRAVLEAIPAARFWGPGETLPPLAAEDASPVLILPESGVDPRPFLEHLRAWLEHHERTLSRLFTIVDCAALEANPALHPYYDLCLHFSDAFLLANRAEGSKKWIQEYRNRLHKLAVPTHIELLRKGGRVADLPALLYPEARRLSQFFDEPDTAPEQPFEIEGFGDDEETHDPRDPEHDPYLQRGDDGSYRVRLRM